jgi:hypothetical protein
VSGRLASLVDRYGVAFATDPSRVRDLLHSSLGDLEPEVSLLVAGSESGVTTDLIGAHGARTDDLLVGLGQRLVNDRGLSPAGARWVVDTWAWALGVEDEAALPEPPIPTALDPEPRPDVEAFLLTERPPFRVRDHAFSVALVAFVVATVATMVVLTRAGPDSVDVVAVPQARAQPEAPATTVVSVPSLIDLTRSEAVQRLRAVGLGHEILTRSTDKARRGVVLRQHPAPGGSLPEGTIVKLVVAAPPKRVGTPSGLSIDRTPTSVTITWDTPRDGSGVDHYVIVRDGEKIGVRAAGRRTFTDGGLFSGYSYRYGVIAIGFNGTHARSRLHVVTLPLPPPSPSPSPSPEPVTGQAPPPPPPPSPSPDPCPAPDPDFCN